MTIPINSTLMKRHMLAYGYTYSNGGGTTEGQNRPIQVDANGVLQQGPTQSGGNVQGFIEVNSDDISETQFAPIEAGFAYAWNPVSTGWDRNLSFATNADAQPAEAQGALGVAAFQFGYNGATFDRVRNVTARHTILATAAGLTAVWTPPAGLRFRLMGYSISVSGTVAATGPQLLQFVDGLVANVIFQHLATVDITTAGPDTQIAVTLGNGYLSNTVNNVLSINLATAAMLTGGVAVNVWGMNE